MGVKRKRSGSDVVLGKRRLEREFRRRISDE